MAGYEVNVLDGSLPTKVTLEVVPEDINSLLDDLERTYVERMRDISARCKNKQMVIYVNWSKLDTFEKKLAAEDRVVILSNMAAG